MTLLLAVGAPRFALGASLTLTDQATVANSFDETTLCVGLRAGPTEEVAGVENQLVWDGEGCATMLPDSCAANPAHGKQLSGDFSRQRDFTYKALILSFSDTDPIPPGELYCCDFVVHLTNPGTCCSVSIKRAAGSDPTGNALSLGYGSPGRLCLSDSAAPGPGGRSRGGGGFGGGTGIVSGGGSGTGSGGGGAGGSAVGSGGGGAGGSTVASGGGSAGGSATGSGGGSAGGSAVGSGGGSPAGSAPSAGGSGGGSPAGSAPSAGGSVASGFVGGDDAQPPVAGGADFAPAGAEAVPVVVPSADGAAPAAIDPRPIAQPAVGDERQAEVAPPKHEVKQGANNAANNAAENALEPAGQAKPAAGHELEAGAADEPGKAADGAEAAADPAAGTTVDGESPAAEPAAERAAAKENGAKPSPRDVQPARSGAGRTRRMPLDDGVGAFGCQTTRPNAAGNPATLAVPALLLLLGRRRRRRRRRRCVAPASTKA